VQERAQETMAKGHGRWLNGVGRTIETGRPAKHPRPHPESQRTSGNVAMAPRGQIPHSGDCAGSETDGRSTTIDYHKGIYQINEESLIRICWGEGWSTVSAIGEWAKG